MWKKLRPASYQTGNEGVEPGFFLVFFGGGVVTRFSENLTSGLEVEVTTIQMRLRFSVAAPMVSI